MGNNSYFYPSVSSSLVFTDLLPSHEAIGLSYGKLRARLDPSGKRRRTRTCWRLAYTRRVPSAEPALRGAEHDRQPDAQARDRPRVGRRRWSWASSTAALNLDLAYYSKATTDQILADPGVADQRLHHSGQRGRGEQQGLRGLGLADPGAHRERLRVGSDAPTTARERERGLRSSSATSDLPMVLGVYWSLNVEARLSEPYGAHLRQRLPARRRRQHHGRAPRASLAATRCAACLATTTPTGSAAASTRSATGAWTSAS